MLLTRARVPDCKLMLSFLKKSLSSTSDSYDGSKGKEAATGANNEQKSVCNLSRVRLDCNSGKCCQSRFSQIVPEALKLRFMAELNQLEGIQHLENQLNRMGSIRDVALANQDADKMAEKIRVSAVIKRLPKSPF